MTYPLDLELEEFPDAKEAPLKEELPVAEEVESNTHQAENAFDDILNQTHKHPEQFLVDTVNLLEHVEKNTTKPFRETYFRLEIGYEGQTAFVVPVINGKRIPPVTIRKDVKIIFEGHADNPSLSFGWIDFVRAMGRRYRI